MLSNPALGHESSTARKAGRAGHLERWAVCLALISAAHFAWAANDAELVSKIEAANYGYSLLCYQYSPRTFAAMQEMKTAYEKKAAAGELSEVETRDLGRANQMLPLLESFTRFKKEVPESMKDDAARQDYLVRLNAALDLCSKMTDIVLKKAAK